MLLQEILISIHNKSSLESAVQIQGLFDYASFHEYLTYIRQTSYIALIWDRCKDTMKEDNEWKAF